MLARLGIPWVGLGSFLAFFAVIGDPILWLIERMRPGTLPVQVFNLFNRPIFLVFRDDGYLWSRYFGRMPVGWRLYVSVASRKVIGLFSEQLRLEFVSVLHRLQGFLAARIVRPQIPQMAVRPPPLPLETPARIGNVGGAAQGARPWFCRFGNR